MPAVFDKILDAKGTERYRKDKQFFAKDKVPTNVLEVLTLQNIVDENGLIIVEDKGDFGGDTPPPAAPGDTSNVQPSVDESKIGTVQPPDAHATANPPAAAPSNAQPSGQAEAPASFDGNPGTPAALPSIPEGNAQAIADTPARAFRSKTPQSDPGMDFPRKNGKTVDIFDGVTPHTHVRLVGGHMVPLSAENYRTRTEAEIEAKLKELGKEIVDFNKYETSPDNGGHTVDDDGGEDDLV